jgi:pyrroline-5-carboxylate reductase
MFKFGFIGTGNMGSALAKAICAKAGEKELAVCDRLASKADALAELLGCKSVCIEELAAQSKYIFIAVKPQALAEMTGSIKDILKARDDRYIIVSMAAGTPIERIESLIGFSCPVIRIMPNVAASVGAGMTLCARNSGVTDEEYNEFIDAMEFSGKLDKVDEEKIDSYSIVTGCGPAWVYMFAEALADGQVDIGVPRDKAYLYAAKTMEGAAKLMLESGKIPAELKDSVCSPGGTTIEGVRALEAGAVRSSVIEAVIAAYKKTLKM